MRLTKTFFVVVGVIVMVASMAEVSADSTTRTIELRLTDHKPGIADFKELNVSLASISVHPAEAPRSEGWLELIAKTPLIDIVPLKDGRYTVLGTVEVPAKRFDAVRIIFSELTSELLSGDDVSVSWRDTTVAKDVDMHGNAHLSLVIDLYAENQTEHVSGGYVVKLKEIRLDE